MTKARCALQGYDEGGLDIVRAKLVAAFLLVLAGLLVVLQNTQPVEAKFLFLSVTMPIAALLALAILIDMAVGILAALGLSGKKPENSHRPGH